MATLDGSISSFNGQSWSYWLEKSKKHTSKDAKAAPQSTHDESKGDSMKLRKEDMSLYGLCPARDEFYLVVCECCGQVIKPQALKKHLAQRHGITSKGSSTGSNISSSHSHKESTSSSKSSTSSHTHGSSSSSHKPSKRPNSSSSGSASTSHAHQLHTKEKIPSSPVPKNKRTPMVKVQRIEPSSMRDKGSSITTPSKSGFVAPIPAEPPDKGKTFKEKEKEVKEPPAKAARIEATACTPTTTIAVTSASLSTPITTTATPMTTASLRVTSTMTTRPQVLTLKSEAIANSTTPTSSRSKEHTSSKLTPSKTVITSAPALSTTSTIAAATSLKKPQTQASITLSTASTVSFSSLKTTASLPVTTSSASSSGTKKPPIKNKNAIKCRDREYDADRHCGVWVVDEGRQCTRSLTCKTHALSLRRAVKGRNKPFDDLLREHREAKDALLRAKAEASGLPMPAPSSKSSKSSKSAPSTPVTVSPSPFKLPTTEGVLNTSSLLSPPPPKTSVVAMPTQKEKLCLSSSLSRQSTLPIFPKSDTIQLPELTNYLSSEGEEDDEDKDKTDYTCISHHPRPAVVNSFGAWKHGNGCYVFNRKEDLYRAAFFAAVERHLHPPPHKKLCVESNLPKGSTMATNTKDPYEFSFSENASMQMRKSSMASRFQVKSPSKSKAATTVGSSPPCGSTKSGDIITSPPHHGNLMDLTESLMSPTNSLPSTPSAKRKRSGSSPVIPSRGTSNGTGTVLGSSNIGTVPCSSPIAITIPATLSFNFNSNTLSNINATLAAKKNVQQQQQAQLASHNKSSVVKDLNRISSDGGGGGNSQVNGQLVISGSNLADMTHIQLNSLSEKCAKAKSNRNINKASFANAKNSSTTSVTSKPSQFIKSHSDITRDTKPSPILSRKSPSSSLTGNSGLAFPILGSVKSGGLLPLDTSFSNTVMELAASSSLSSSAAAITLTTSSSGSSSSPQPSPVQHGSPVLLSGASSPTSPLPNGLLSPTNPSRYAGGTNHLPGSDIKNINLALTEQLLAQQLPGPFSLTGVPVKSDNSAGRGLASSHPSGRGTSLPTLSPAAATAQQLAAAALNLTTQPGGCILTTNSTAPQLYATQVLARPSPNTPLASLQLQAKTGGSLKGLGASAAKVPLQPLSLTIVAPGSSVVPSSQHQQTHMVLHPHSTTATDPDNQAHSTASNVPS